MERLIEFAGNHPLLVTAFLVVAGLLVANLLGDVLGGARRIGAAQAVRLINDRDAVVVDVREQRDFERGHIVDAVHLPYGKLAAEAEGRLPADKQQPLLLCCNSGSIAGRAAAELKKTGYQEIHVLKGGVMAWQNEGLPLERA